MSPRIPILASSPIVHPAILACYTAGKNDQKQVRAAAENKGWVVDRFERTGKKPTDFFVASLVLR